MVTPRSEKEVAEAKKTLRLVREWVKAIRKGLKIDLPPRIAVRYSLTVSTSIPDDPDEVRPANDNVLRSALVEALEDGLEYVERFADQNNETARGHCRRTIAKMKAALAKARRSE